MRRLSGVALGLGLAACPLAARDAKPLGRILWTQHKGRSAHVESKLYVPDGVPSNLYQDGMVKVDSATLILTDRKRAGTVSSTEMRDDTADAPVGSPKAKLRFLHPTYDFTGKRLLFVAGDSWGPNLTDSSSDPVSGGTALFFGKYEQSNQVSEPPPNGGGMDAFPTADGAAKWVYFARFFYQGNGGSPPGWYLMKVNREASEKVERGREEPVTDGNGHVRGSQPKVTPNGDYLFFVRQDPENNGSDIYYMPLDTESGNAARDAKLLVQGEGAAFTMPQAGHDWQAWVDWSRELGRARIDHPSPAPDLSFIAYASDRDGDWDLWLQRLEVDESSGELSLDGEEERLIAGSEDDTTDEMWPSVSGDGLFVAYMSNHDSGTGSSRGELPDGRTRIWVSEVDLDNLPSNSEQLVSDPGGDASQMWPAWDQDEDPPHLLVVLHPQGGGTPLRLMIQDQEPEKTGRVDRVSFSLEHYDYFPDAPPPGSRAARRLKPFRIGFDNKTPRATIEYEVGDPNSNSSTDVGRNPFSGDDLRRANSFHLLLSGKRERAGLHRGFKSLKIEAGTDDPGSDATPAADIDDLGSDEFDGLYLFENERLRIEVYSRDNRWLRVGPDDASQRAMYDEDPVKEAAQILPKDPRSQATPPNEAKPPYLKLRPPRDIMEENHPGICWWIEESARDATEDSDFDAPRDFNAPYVMFRYSNYPPEAYAGDASRNKDIYMRFVARDLLGNMTDVRIPLHVRGKDFKVDTLRSGTARRDN